MARYRNYIFDLYGTLADILTDESSPRLWRLAAMYYGEHGAQYSGPELKAAYLRLCETEQAKSPDPLYEIELRRVFDALYREKGSEPDARLVEETAVFFRISSTKKLRLYPWVNKLLPIICGQGSRVFLLSNAQACFTRPELRLLGLDSAFDAVVLSSEAGVKKPSPLIMRALTEAAGIDPAESIMVGNDQRSDIAVARAFDMDALYIRTETSGPYEKALAAKYELTDGDYSKLPGLLGVDRQKRKRP